jgi:hypothetical protein
MGCTCDIENHEFDICPFAEEILGETEKTCNCCEYCREKCMQDI